MNRFRCFDAMASANTHQSNAKRVAWLLGLAGSKVRDSRLSAASLFCNLALRDALFGNRRDVIFPLHSQDYIGLPIYLQSDIRYRNSVCS